jgi:hypothetical protein
VYLPTTDGWRGTYEPSLVHKQSVGCRPTTRACIRYALCSHRKALEPVNRGDGGDYGAEDGIQTSKTQNAAIDWRFLAHAVFFALVLLATNNFSS